MNTALQDAILEAFAIAPSNQVVFHTLEITQQGVQGSIYLVKARRSIVAYDENSVARTFEPSGFEFSLPPSTEEGYQSLNIAIDNIGRRVSDFIDTAKSQSVPVKVIYRPYVSTDLSAPQMDPPLVLYLKDVKENAMQVTGRATMMDLANKKFPLELYTRARFPTLG